MQFGPSPYCPFGRNSDFSRDRTEDCLSTAKDEGNVVNLLSDISDVRMLGPQLETSLDRQSLHHHQ